ncbi:hypothetical protein SISSUDRAFT_1040745 [Sistotremastrum suecicum HHB10207 ss-3]|uniref:ER membrane protein complex subunit 10 n=1 Tax=Sistotremastrum suecicum HHB10207 ss-3 TaxID=1314776 RepID=A0A166HMX7_9AGAM|nr:hypothetical protein SISSUDRAFT_1040745 [Sistotremastrum suecicum HHB10207 ss-3]
MFLLLLLPALALAADVRIHHRITGQPWSLRAELHGDHLETIQPYSQLIPPSYAPGARYQLALERPSDKDSNSWDLASVYLCHLSSAVSDTIVVHEFDGVPYALDYRVTPVPRDGSCPSLVSSISIPNTTISFSSARVPPSPALRAPPPLTPEGQVVPPVPERSFLQKYWVYIAIFVGVMLFASGPEEEAPAAAPRARS